MALYPNGKKRGSETQVVDVDPDMQIAVDDKNINYKTAKSSVWKPIIALSKLKGADGQDADPTNFEVGNVTSLANGKSPTVTISGEGTKQTISFGIPMAKDGAPGKDGDDATTTEVATTTEHGLMAAADKLKLDGLGLRASAAVSSGTRKIGESFIISEKRDSRATYTIGYSLSATLTVGQNIQIIATVDGKEVGRVMDAIILGLAGSISKTRTLSFDIPAGKAVLFTKSGTSSVTATVVSGQETIL